MAFWLKSGRQMVRLSSSSSWSAKPSPPPLIIRVLTSSVYNNTSNCFSTSSSPDAALKDKLVTCVEFIAKCVVNFIHTKPLPSDPCFHKFIDDQLEKISTATTPRLYTADEVIKKILEQSQIIHTLQFQEEKPYKVRGEDFEFDTSLKVNVFGLGKEDLVVWVYEEHVLVGSTTRVWAPKKTVEQVIRLPDGLDYNPDEVTGTVMEDGRLNITFPGSKEEGGKQKAKYFKVKLV